MTQMEMLINHFQHGHSITQAEALDRFGIGRLASRITDLKNKGYDVEVADEVVRNRFNKKVMIARYRFKRPEKQGELNLNC